MAHLRDSRNAKLWWGSLKKTDHLHNRGIDRRIILKWTLKEKMRGCRHKGGITIM
jgi:hypothetical protein